MKIINYTPHTVVVHDDDAKTRTYNPCGTVARVSTERIVRGWVGEGDCMFPISQVTFGATVDLPPPQKSILETGTLGYEIYIVSAMVRLANPDRMDLVSPGELIRDEKGIVAGCDGFDTNATTNIFQPSSL